MQESASLSPVVPQPDLSVYLAFPPEKVLPFFYGQTLYLPLDVWQALQKEAETAPKNGARACRGWLRLIRRLEAEKSLALLAQNPGLACVGPFYELADKVLFFFPRCATSAGFSAGELEKRLQALETFTPPDSVLAAFLAGRNAAVKRSAPTAEELLKEIALCQTALAERQRLAAQCDMIREFAAGCGAARKQAVSLPPEPVLTQERPEPLPRETSSLRQRLHRLLARTPSAVSVSPERQTYFLSLRLYDQACARYKEAREKWAARQKDYYLKVSAAEKDALARLAQAEKALQLCSRVLEKTVIHPHYQQPEILAAFAGYLETGRAAQLKACINLYEEEQRWQELKNSQHRIEQTILRWQEPDKRPLDSETLAFLQSVRSLLKDA